jgi:hypothetical protein
MPRFTMWGPTGLMTVEAADEKDALERVVRGEGEPFPPEPPMAPIGDLRLRDYFAAAALPLTGLGGPGWRAQQAYELADAMLAERRTKR